MVGVKCPLIKNLYHPSNFLPSLKTALYINFKKLPPPPFNFRLAAPMTKTLYSQRCIKLHLKQLAKNPLFYKICNKYRTNLKDMCERALLRLAQSSF